MIEIETENSLRKKMDQASNWHGKKIYKVPLGKYNDREICDINIVVCGTIMGCGLAQIYGVASIDKSLIEEAKKVMDIIKRDFSGAGGFICTLGQRYSNQESVVTALGFEKISEYSNPTHGSNYNQSLYILKQ